MWAVLACRIVTGMRTLTRALVALSVVTSVAVAAPEAHAQFGFPVPAEPTAEDLLSTENEAGNATGIVPGAGACDSAVGRDLSFPADDAPHADALEEWWFWTVQVTTADRRRLAFMAYFLSRGARGPYLADAAIYASPSVARR